MRFERKRTLAGSKIARQPEDTCTKWSRCTGEFFRGLSNPGHLFAIDRSIGRAPAILVVFATAQEIEVDVAFPYRFVDCVRDENRARAVLPKLRIETAEVVVSATAVMKRVERRDDAIVETQPIQSQRVMREQTVGRVVMKILHFIIAQHA